MQDQKGRSVLPVQMQIHLEADRRSSNATKPLQSVQTVYDGDGNVRAMENIYAGLPSTSALVHYRLCHRGVKVAHHPCNKHYSNHCPMDGTLQTRMDSGNLPSLVYSPFQRIRPNLLSVAHRHRSHLRLQAKVLSTTAL